MSAEAEALLDALKVFFRGDPGPPGPPGLPPGHISGFTLSNNVIDPTTRIDIAAGKVRDSTDSVDIVLPAGLTKRLDATWAVGSGNGGRDAGPLADGWWHVHAVYRADTQLADAIQSLSATAPDLPDDYTHFRRLGSIWRTGGAIKAFSQSGNQFLWKSAVREVAGGTPGFAPGAYYTLSAVPTGVQVDAIVSALLIGDALSYNKLRSPDATASAASGTDYDTASDPSQTLSSIQAERRTDTTARLFASCSSAATTLDLMTLGWNDPL